MVWEGPNYTELTLIDPVENRRSDVFKTDQPFDIRVDWEVSGPAARAKATGGTWHLALHIYGVGGLETTQEQLATADIPAMITSDPASFSHTFHVAANTVQPGTYRLIAGLTFSPADDPNQSTEIVSFIESELVMFVE